MGYIVGFVAAVPAANKDVYIGHANDATPLFKKLGAERVLEAWSDDVPEGDKTDFYRAVDAREGEAIAYAFHEYPDRETADAADEAMQDDPAMAEMGATMPFDARRMIWGGFQSISDVKGGGETGYIEGSLIPVPSDNREAHAAYAERVAKLLVEYGAVRSVDAWGAMVPDGEVTDFKRAVAATDDETVVFSWIEWPTKQVRDEAWPKLMQDPRLHEENGSGADEGRRVFGGFVPVLEV